MQDSDIEDLLRKYRPVGPSAGLRERIVATARTPRTWPWTAAAAALLAMGVMFQSAARKETHGADVNIGPSAIARVTEDLTVRLGGDSRARALAELIVVEQEVRREISSALIAPVSSGGGVHR